MSDEESQGPSSPFLVTHHSSLITHHSIMHITLTGLSHKSAPVEIRERLAVEPGIAPEWLLSLREAAGLEECALIATCNRMEVYFQTAAAPEAEGRQERLFQHLAAQAGVSEARLQPHLY